MGSGFIVRNFADLTQAGQALALRVEECLRQGLQAGERASLAVPGGRTPGAFFAALFARPLPWSRIDLTLTDDRWVAPDCEHSNIRLVEACRRGTPAQAARLLPLTTGHSSPALGMEELEQRLSVLPELLDAVVLGMGDDGHIASLFPGQPHEDGQSPCLPGLAPVSPHLRVSLSQSRLLASRKHFLLFSGAAKLAVLQQDQAGLPVHRFLGNLPDPAEIFHATA
jgi:6-phosphogluconolactonase